jgi:hypothetical protein
LVGLGYESVKIHDGEAFVSNLKTQLEVFNNTSFTAKEFDAILNHLAKGNVFEKAKTLYEETVRTVTEKDLEEIYIDVGQDKFEVSIPWIEFYDVDEKRRNVEFGFAIIDCYLETKDGMKTYEEMLDDNFSDYEFR